LAGFKVHRSLALTALERPVPATAVIQPSCLTDRSQS